MISATSFTRLSAARSLQMFFWSCPEWWSVALFSVAWTVMVLHGWQNAIHGVHHPMTFSQELQYWLLMVAAMMLPLVIDRVRLTAGSSLWARRHRAIAGFLVGYFMPWLLLGLVAAGVREAWPAHMDIAAALCFGAAALWQRTAVHARAVTACHRSRPLAPAGWRADRDCLHSGGAMGAACLWSCWPLMLACMFAGHGLIAMTGGMVVGAAERWSFRPRTRVMLAVTLAMAGYYALQAGLPQLAGIASHLR